MPRRMKHQRARQHRSVAWTTSCSLGCSARSIYHTCRARAVARTKRARRRGLACGAPRSPFHDRTIMVTNCDPLPHGRKINFSHVFAGQKVGVTQVGDRIWLVTRLSSRTFWTFVREFSPFKGRRGRSMIGEADPRHGSGSSTLGTACGPVSPRSPRGARVHESRRRSGGQQPGHATALSDVHVSQDADRLASTRARRPAAERAVRSAGTACPGPKYISFGVCPRNAECGSPALCSWT